MEQQGIDRVIGLVEGAGGGSDVDVFSEGCPC